MPVPWVVSYCGTDCATCRSIADATDSGMSGPLSIRIAQVSVFSAPPGAVAPWVPASPRSSATWPLLSFWSSCGGGFRVADSEWSMPTGWCETPVFQTCGSLYEVTVPVKFRHVLELGGPNGNSHVAAKWYIYTVYPNAPNGAYNVQNGRVYVWNMTYYWGGFRGQCSHLLHTWSIWQNGTYGYIWCIPRMLYP